MSAATTRPSKNTSNVETHKEIKEIYPPHEVLGRRAPRNVWRHSLRDAGRVLALVFADIAVYLGVRNVLHGVRDGVLGDAVATLVLRFFPPGFLGGTQFVVALILGMLIVGGYGAGDRRRDPVRVFSGVGLAGLLALYGSAWLIPIATVALQYSASVLVMSVALVVARAGVDFAVRKLRPQLGGAKGVVVSSGNVDWVNLSRLFSGSGELSLVRSVSLDNGATCVGDNALLELGAIIEHSNADTVLLWGNLSDAQYRVAVDAALAAGCRLLAAPRVQTDLSVEPRSVCLEGLRFMELSAPGLQAWQRAVKRAIDIIGSSLGLLVLSPLLAAVAVWVKLDSSGSVVFAQERLGRHGRRFRCYKFRSMLQNAEEVLRSDPALHQLYLDSDYKLPEDRDPRLTNSGRFLRKTSLDELPQLVNVLLGQMSLIGPRPIVPNEIEHYEQGAPLFLSLRPGITGAWAANGRSKIGYPDRAHMELEYVRNWSLFSDLAILVKTVPAVIRSRGAH